MHGVLWCSAAAILPLSSSSWVFLDHPSASRQAVLVLPPAEKAAALCSQPRSCSNPCCCVQARNRLIAVKAAQAGAAIRKKEGELSGSDEEAEDRSVRGERRALQVSLQRDTEEVHRTITCCWCYQQGCATCCQELSNACTTASLAAAAVGTASNASVC